MVETDVHADAADGVAPFSFPCPDDPGFIV